MGKHKRKNKDKDEDLFILFKKFAKCMRENSSDEDETSNKQQEVEAPEITIDQAESVDNNNEGTEIPPIDPENNGGPSLDDEILEILGEDPNTNKKYSEKIHKDISLRWSHTVQSGLEKETKTELYKRYLVPENCLFLEAPLLNPEVKAAVSETVFKRDRALLNNQNNLGQVAGCLGKALDTLILQKENKEVTKIISDAGRMICDIFHNESVSRRTLLQFALNKPTKDIVSQAAVGKYIFGDNLNEALKAGKAITKTGTEIKFSRPQNVKPTIKSAALNSRGPPRRFPPPQQPSSAGKPSSFKPKPAAAPQRRSAPIPRTSSAHRKN